MRTARVYLMRAGDLLKIGMTGDVRKRYRTINSMNSVPVELVGNTHPMDRSKASELEARLHQDFSQKHVRFEWFACEAAEVLEKIAELEPDASGAELVYIPEVHTRTPLPDKEMMSFEAGTLDRIRAATRPDERAADFCREAVEMLLKRRERRGVRVTNPYTTPRIEQGLNPYTGEAQKGER